MPLPACRPGAATLIEVKLCLNEDAVDLTFGIIANVAKVLALRLRELPQKGNGLSTSGLARTCAGSMRSSVRQRQRRLRVPPVPEQSDGTQAIVDAERAERGAEVNL